MMRKLLAIIALGLFVAVSMMACGGEEDPTPEQLQEEENPPVAI